MSAESERRETLHRVVISAPSSHTRTLFASTWFEKSAESVTKRLTTFAPGGGCCATRRTMLTGGGFGGGMGRTGGA
jgi:hypothetical protein